MAVPAFERTLAQGNGTTVQATTVAAVGPAAVVYDSAGNLYLAAARDHVVRRVDTLGFVTVVAGTGEQGFSGDGGSATAAQLDTPSGLAVDSAGNLYIADTHNHRVRRVAGGVITTVAGTGSPGFSGGDATSAAQLDLPAGLALDSAGNLYIADSGNHAVRRLAGTVVTTVAGTGEQGYAGDGGSATAAQLDAPTGVAVDPTVTGQFYIADRHNNRVRLVSAAGVISTVAGTGSPSFSGDGGTAAAAGLAGPRGIAVSSTGAVYVADADNQRVRAISRGAISTAAGTGEQGFAGDIGAAASATLDTPVAAALNGTGVLAFADTHNDRVRALSGTALNTVAGVAPPLTESILLAGPTAGVFGTALGQITATFGNNGKQASGQAVLYRDGISVGSTAFASNIAAFNLAGTPGGLHAFAVAFAGDTANGPGASGVYLVNVSAAQQTVNFPALPNPVTYTAGLTATLAATASSGLPITYSVIGPATVNGATLTYTGTGNVLITASQPGSSDYAAASASQTVTVLAPVVPPPPTIASVTPNTATLGASNLLIAVAGGNFTPTSVVQYNGMAVSTTFVSSALLNATLPQLLAVGSQSITVYDSSTGQTSVAAAIAVTAPQANATFSVPATSTSGQQPALNLQLGTAYPVPITGVLTLSFVPDGSIGVNDPNIQLSTGGRALNFNVAANTTTVPTVAVQTGTVAGVITITLTLTAQGIDVTPASARVATIVIPRQAPVITSTSFTQSGSTLTVVTRGYSNTRDMTSASFTFTGAPGTKLSTDNLSVPVSAIFTSWFSDPNSTVGGSVFTYTQIFTLSDAGTTIQSVGVTLSNSVGAGSRATSP